MTTDNSTKPLTTTEAAEYLRMPIGNLYKLTCSGRIRHFKPTGGRIYFLQEDLDEFIRQGCREADYHLNFLGRALTNHTSWDVQAALVSMSFREFKEWAKTPGPGFEKKYRKASTGKEPLVPKEQMETYQAEIKAAFHRDIEVFMIGCRSQEDLEKSRKALQDHVRSISISTSKVEGDADALSNSESSPSLAPPKADSMSA